MEEALQQARRAHKAQELVRTRQQGFGKAIISAKVHGIRTVAINNKIAWSRKWVFFTDFLVSFLKHVLGQEWAARALRDGLDHPVFRWTELLSRREGVEQHDHTRGVPELGYMTSLFGLAYSLYLIAHHDELPKSLLARLRNPRPEVFRPAVYEALVAAAFAVAGFRIEGAELVKTSEKTPEFWATSKSGTRYAVEAKCKLTWKSPCDPSDPSFCAELRAWIRDKLYSASLKKLNNAVYWFELSIPAELTEDQYRTIRDLVVASLRDAENLTVRGEPPNPAYVFVTNNTHMVLEMVRGSPFAAMLEGYRIDDMRSGIQVSLEKAFDIRDRHRDINRVFECLAEVQRVPMSFDGHPSELLTSTGDPIPTMKIGSKLELDFSDGTRLAGILREIAVLDDDAWVVIEDESGRHNIASMPLTPQEAAAARTHGEAIFGKPEGVQENSVGDPVKLYDWLLETFADYPVEGLVRQISTHPAVEEIAALPRDQMHIRVAREVAKAIHSYGSKDN